MAFLRVFTEKDGVEDLSVEQEMHGSFRKAAVNLKEIIKVPGVWDLFVKPYVDVRVYFYRSLPSVSFGSLSHFHLNASRQFSCVWMTSSFKNNICNDIPLALI